MIARIWHGKTKKKDLEAYSELLKKLAIPDYSETPGFQGLKFLRNVKGAEAHFTLITFWDDMDSIRRFAGEDYELAKYYREDNDYLLEFEKFVQHAEVFAS